MKNLLSAILIFFIQSAIFSQTGNVSNEAYVLGDFKQEAILTAYSNPGESRIYYLRKEVLEKFLELIQAYQRENPEENKDRSSYLLFVPLKIRREFGRKNIPEKGK
ncbi:hypothetical protein LEP1GSC043_0405 [Leptospira weilii str. Ecochallenge]|uniref:Uncharacterized protein n=1 Tax=Leptospira weilii str. Ecochallenge TaxID=1049986 RepID=N1U9A0_9LEPT|nr:hypothetical protein LEP1GSC043_0405 [Leptospira weilii str. Ecochallenge]